MPKKIDAASRDWAVGRPAMPQQLNNSFSTRMYRRRYDLSDGGVAPPGRVEKRVVHLDANHLNLGAADINNLIAELADATDESSGWIRRERRSGAGEAFARDNGDAPALTSCRNYAGNHRDFPLAEEISSVTPTQLA